jgi:hypothetical protein
MFDFQTNLGVNLLVSPLNGFRLNISALDGPDLLATDSAPDQEYVNFAQFCSEVIYSNGVTATGTTIDLGSKTGTIVLSAEDADPLEGYLLKISDLVAISLNDYIGAGEVYVLEGVVKSIQRDTDSTGLNRVIINFGDQIEQLNSTEMTISEIADQTFSERWTAIDANLDLTLSLLKSGTLGEAEFTFPGIDIFETAVGDTVLETMQGELGWLYTDNVGVIWPVCHGYLADQLDGPVSWTISNTVTSTEIPPTYINRSSSSDSIVSTINAALTWDPGTTISFTDTDQADLYGNSTLDVEVNLADETNLSNWAFYGLTLTGQQNIQALSLDAINHANSELYDVYYMNPTDCVLVNVQQGATSVNENYLISRVTHTITPNTWQTDLELWRN